MPRAEVVITMLANDPALEKIVFGESGILQALAPGAIHLSMSTISVELAERLAAAHREKGQEFVSAPVFGRPDLAAAGKLFVIAAALGLLAKRDAGKSPTLMPPK